MTALSHQQCLVEDLKWLHNRCDDNPGLRNAIKRFEAADVVIKPKYWPAPEASTTINTGLIYLARNWNTWAPLSRRANIIHEAAHLPQYTGANPTWWKVKYIASEEFRAKAEIDAAIEEIRFYKHIGYKLDFQHFIAHLVDSHRMKASRKRDLLPYFESMWKVL